MLTTMLLAGSLTSYLFWNHFATQYLFTTTTAAMWSQWHRRLIFFQLSQQGLDRENPHMQLTAPTQSSSAFLYGTSVPLVCPLGLSPWSKQQNCGKPTRYETREGARGIWCKRCSDLRSIYFRTVFIESRDYVFLFLTVQNENSKKKNMFAIIVLSAH